MSKENKIHTTIMLTMMTLLILLIGFGIGRCIFDGEMKIWNLLIIIIYGLLFVPILYIAIVSFIVRAVIDEERFKR